MGDDDQHDGNRDHRAEQRTTGRAQGGKAHASATAGGEAENVGAQDGRWRDAGASADGRPGGGARSLGAEGGEAQDPGTQPDTLKNDATRQRGDAQATREDNRSRDGKGSIGSDDDHDDEDTEAEPGDDARDVGARNIRTRNIGSAPPHSRGSIGNDDSDSGSVADSDGDGEADSGSGSGGSGDTDNPDDNDNLDDDDDHLDDSDNDGENDSDNPVVSEIEALDKGSAIALIGHPIHAMLIHFPIALVFGVLAMDVLFWLTDDAFFARAGVWGAGTAFLGGAVASLVGLAELLLVPGIRARGSSWTHATAAMTFLASCAVNWGLRLDGSIPVVPDGMAVSTLSAVLVGVAGWHGGKLIFDEGIALTASTTD